MEKALYPVNQDNYYRNIMQAPLGVALPINPTWPDTYKVSISRFNQYLENSSISLEGVLNFIKEGIRDYQLHRMSLSSLKVRVFAIKKAVRELLEQQGRKLELAVIMQELDRLHIPKTEKQAAVEALTKDELKELVENIPDHYRPLIAFLINTGLRIQEALDTRYEHCREDLLYNRIEILADNSPKLTWISRSLFRKIKETYSGNKWLFETRNGKQIDRYSVYRALQKASSALGWMSRDGQSRINPNLLRYSHLVHSENIKLRGRKNKEIIQNY